jgi:hypothetical protein
MLKRFVLDELPGHSELSAHLLNNPYSDAKIMLRPGRFDWAFEVRSQITHAQLSSRLKRFVLDELPVHLKFVEGK